MSTPDDDGSGGSPGAPLPELELPADWPGLDGRNAPVFMDHTRVREILKRLRSQLGSLEGSAPPTGSATMSGPGTVDEVQVLSRVDSAETGTWGAAGYFGQNAANASTVLSDTYRSLVQRVEATITALEKAVENYEKGHTRSSA